MTEYLQHFEISSIPLLPRQFFQLEIYNSDGSRLTESQIHSQLLRIRAQSWKTDKEPVGILTSEHRHTWGQAYNRLLTGRSQSVGASTLVHSVLSFMHMLKSELYIIIYQYHNTDETVAGYAQI